MERVNKNEFAVFCDKVRKARAFKNLPELHYHDLRHYCQTLINSASVFQLIASMECSDRFDLVEDTDQEEPLGTHILVSDLVAFTDKYLGLELVSHGDPRGSVFKLKVDPSLGDSFGDRSDLCVPCVDAYQNFV